MKSVLQLTLTDHVPASPDPDACGTGACRSESVGATRLAILRALGEAGRLSVTVREGRCIYRALDSRTGAVRREWTEAAFLNLIRGVREVVFTDIDAGLSL